MIQVFEIDNDGYYIREIIINSNVDDDLYILIRPPDGMYRPRWTGTEWIEDMTQEEIEELKKDNEVINNLSIEERLKVAEEIILFLLEGGL